MSLQLLLSIKLTPNVRMSIIELDDMNFTDKVEKLRIKTATHIKLHKDSFDLLYCGTILDDDNLLNFYGLKNRSIINVISKPKLNKSTTVATSTNKQQTDLEEIVSAFKSFVSDAVLKSALCRLFKKQDVIKNIVNGVPTFKEDPVAISLLQDSYLMSYFTDIETVKRINQHHPSLIDVAMRIVAAVHREVQEHKENPSSDSNSGTSNDSNSSASEMNSRATNSVTLEMLNQAVQHAFANSIIHQPLVTPVSPSEIQERLNRMQRNLVFMREMGLANHSINSQALYLTNGNLQAAIELVLSDFGNDL